MIIQGKLLHYTKLFSGTNYRLLGVIYGDSRFEDSHRVQTSFVVSEFIQDAVRYAKTETGSIYELGIELSTQEFYEKEKDVSFGIPISNALKDLLNID